MNILEQKQEDSQASWPTAHKSYVPVISSIAIIELIYHINVNFYTSHDLFFDGF